MKTMRSSRFAVSWSILAAGALSAGGLAGCTVADAYDPSMDNELPLPDGVSVMGEFKVHMSPSDGRMEIWRITRPEPGRSPLSQSTLTIVADDASGSGPANTVELVTNSVNTDTSCPAQGAQTTNLLCGNVTLNHFFASQGFNNMYVQVTKIMDANYQDIANHNALNSDAAALGLSNTLGLWLYTADAYVANAKPSGIFGKYVAGSASDNSGTKDWVFNRPDNTDTYLILRVVASPTYANYTRTKTQGAGVSFIDACAQAGATKNALAPASTINVTLPFPFTLYGGGDKSVNYGYTSLQVNYNRRGSITLASTATAGATPQSLPCTGLFCIKPAIFPFWEDLTYNGTGLTCHALMGSAPNRRLVITWNTQKFTNDAAGMTNLTFSAYLYEGTDQFEFVYQTMSDTGNQARANGNGAVVGAQDATGKVATAGATKGGTSTDVTNGTLSYLFTPYF